MPARTPMPLRFYSSNISLFGFAIFGGALIWLGKDLLFHIEDVVVQVLSGLTLLIGVLFVYSSFSLILNPKPALSVTRYQIGRYYIFSKNRERVLNFKEIKNLTLDYHINRDVKHWFIKIELKNGKKEHFPLHKMLLNGDKVNEKEVFDFVEQVFHGQIPPTRHHIEMDMDDRITTSGKIMWLLMGGMLLFGLIMNILK